MNLKESWHFAYKLQFISILLLLTIFVPEVVNADVMAKFKPVSIAVVDFRGVLAKSSAALSIREKLDKERVKYKKEFSGLEKKLRAAQQKLAKQRAIITAEAFDKRARELKEDARQAQKRAQATNQGLKKSFDKAMDKVRKELLKIIAEVAEETGAGVVLFRSAIVIAVKELEISQEVLKRLNKRLPAVEVIFAQKK
jgi:outer membrane protein